MPLLRGPTARIPLLRGPTTLDVDVKREAMSPL